jgi:hypothetical protein
MKSTERRVYKRHAVSAKNYKNSRVAGITTPAMRKPGEEGAGSRENTRESRLRARN